MHQRRPIVATPAPSYTAGVFGPSRDGTWDVLTVANGTDLVTLELRACRATHRATVSLHVGITQVSVTHGHILDLRTQVLADGLYCLYAGMGRPTCIDLTLPAYERISAWLQQVQAPVPPAGRMAA